MKHLEFPLIYAIHYWSVFVVSKWVWKHPTYRIAKAANLHKVAVEHRFFNDLRWFIQDSCHFTGEANFLAFLLVDVTAERN